MSNELELCTFSIPWGEIHVLILVLLRQTLVHGISTCANSLGHRIASELGKKYIKTSYQQTERVAISVKGIVSMSLSSQIKENTIIIYLTALLASCLDEAKLLIKHWTIPLNKDTPPIDSNLICPRELRLISFSGWFLCIVNVFPISKWLSQGYNFYNSFCPRVVTNLGTAI